MSVVRIKRIPSKAANGKLRVNVGKDKQVLKEGEVGVFEVAANETHRMEFMLGMMDAGSISFRANEDEVVDLEFYVDSKLYALIAVGMILGALLLFYSVVALKLPVVSISSGILLMVCLGIMKRIYKVRRVNITE